MPPKPVSLAAVDGPAACERRQGGDRRVDPLARDPLLTAALDTLRLSISDQINALQEAREWSLARLARESRVSEHGLLDTLKGVNNTKILTLVAIADAHDCDVVVRLRPRRRPATR